MRNAYFLFVGVIVLAGLLSIGYLVYKSGNDFNRAAGWSFEYRVEIDKIEASNWVVIGVYEGILNSGISVMYGHDKSRIESAKDALTNLGCPTDVLFVEEATLAEMSDEQFRKMLRGLDAH